MINSFSGQLPGQKKYLLELLHTASVSQPSFGFHCWKGGLSSEEGKSTIINANNREKKHII